MTTNKTNKLNVYKVPERMKKKVRAFLNDFLKEHDISKPEVIKKMSAEYGRTTSKAAFYDKFTRASFKLVEVMEILDLFGYELKIVSKRAIEHAEPSTTTKF